MQQPPMQNVNNESASGSRACSRDCVCGFLFSTIKLPSGVGNVDGAVITMERTMCFGICPTHSLAIHGNRTVNYEDFAFVAVTGSHTYQISKEKVEQLVCEFHRINYFSLEDRYEESQ
jgi:hypothetical protein